MAQQQDEFRVNTPGVLTPGTGGGFMPVLIDDIIDPRYPAEGEIGAVLSIFRPGELAPVQGLEKIPIPRGAMLCYIDPETAAHLRPIIQAAIRQQREQVQREMQRRGEMGRRS